jgi:hypothetical protein
MKRFSMLALLAGLVCMSTVTIHTTQPPSTPNAECKTFSFAALGDTAYTAGFERELLELITGTLNQEQTRFVVHVGDFQADPRVAANFPDFLVATTAAQLQRPRDILFSINKPFILTPGDNDWSDTVSAPVNNPDPIGTLNAVRTLFYSTSNVAFPFNVVSQPDEFPEFFEYIENRRWEIARPPRAESARHVASCQIVFATVHTISDDNGLTHPSQAVRDESARRILANQAWLERAFDVAAARRARGVVIFTQAAINFTNPSAGFKPMIDLLQAKAAAFDPALQILLIYGDSHAFVVNKPFRGDTIVAPTSGVTRFRQRENVTAIQVPGFPFTFNTGATGRIRVTVNFDDPDLFSLYLSTRNERVQQ